MSIYILLLIFGNSMNTKINQPSHLKWLESLRGIACLAVVFEHYLDPKIFYFSLGNFGVIVFFIISGYIVTSSTIRKENETPMSFVMLRVARLYPAYIISVLLCFFVYQSTIPDLLANITMFQRFIGFKDINGVYWTLQIEWVFYLIIAASLLMTGISKAKLKFAFIAFVTIAIVFGLIRYFGNIKAPSAMPIGLSVILISAIFTTEKDNHQRLIYGSAFIFFIVIASSFLSYSKDWGYNENPYRFIISDLSAISVFLSFKILRPKIMILEFFGKISFSLYLFHLPILKITSGIIGANSQISVIASLIISVIVSYLIFKFVEMPSNTAMKKIVNARLLRQQSSQ